MTEPLVTKIVGRTWDMPYHKIKWMIKEHISESVDEVLSPVFVTNIDSIESKWQLGLLKTKTQYLVNPVTRTMYLSMFIKHLSEANIDAAIAITVFDCDQKIFRGEPQMQNFNGIKESVISQCIMNRADLQIWDGEKHWDETIKVTIICEIEIKPSDESKLFSKSKLGGFDGFEKLLGDKKFSDIIFNVNGKQLYAHKNILAHSSAVFAAMFESEMMETKRNMVEIKDITCEVFREMLRYIYSGKVNELEKFSYDLFVAADKYFIGGLKEICEQTLCHKLTTENALEYLNLADKHNAFHLKAKTLEFITSSAAAIVHKPELKSLNLDLVIEVLRSLAPNK